MCRILSAQFEFRPRLPARSMPETYMRWGGFSGGLTQCYVGARVGSGDERASPVGDVRVAGQLVSVLATCVERCWTIHFDPFMLRG